VLIQSIYGFPFEVLPQKECVLSEGTGVHEKAVTDSESLATQESKRPKYCWLGPNYQLDQSVRD
jgi:hypothetical protein